MRGDVFYFAIHLHMLFLSSTGTVISSYCTFLWWKMSADCHKDFNACVEGMTACAFCVGPARGAKQDTWNVLVTRRKCFSLFFRSATSARLPWQHIWQFWCDFDRASSLICGNKMSSTCNRGFYCRSYCLLNMFRATICPSSGAQEYYTVVAACGISCI